MSPDELARELEDLRRFAPPAGDPMALLERDTRIRDLEQENAELQQLANSRASYLASLSLDFDRQKQQLLTLQAAHDSLAWKAESHDAELHLHDQFWSLSATKERAAKRSFFLKLASWISLSVVSVALAFAIVQAISKYWSFTHDEHLRMLEKANQEHAQANDTLKEARRLFERTTRLQKQSRRPKQPAARPAVDDQNGTPGEAK